jgi:hypothetical protein
LGSCPSLVAFRRSLCGAVCTMSLCAFCCEGQGCTSQEIRFGLWKRVRVLSGNREKWGQFRLSPFFLSPFFPPFFAPFFPAVPGGPGAQRPGGVATSRLVRTLGGLASRELGETGDRRNVRNGVAPEFVNVPSSPRRVGHPLKSTREGRIQTYSYGIRRHRGFWTDLLR